MVAVETRHALPIARLGAAKLRVTHARSLVLEFFKDFPDTELAMQDIFRGLAQRGTPISGGTLPRCLRELVRHGLLVERKIVRGQTRYAARESSLFVWVA